MNIEQMRVLDAIVTQGGFRAASEALNKVQSAVSYAIKTLEEELGLEVFDRRAYRPRLTPEGAVIHRKARVLLAEMDDLDRLARHLRQAEEPLFRMDIAPTAPMAPLVPHLRDLAAVFPATRFEITSETFGGEGLVVEGQVDLALTDMIAEHADLEAKDWGDTRLLAVAAASHPLTECPVITRSEVLKHTQIVVSSGAQKTQRRSRGVFQGASTWTVSGFDAKKTLLLSGMGWGNMPDHLVEEELASGTLKPVCIPGMEETVVRLRAVRKRSEVHGRVAQALWALLDAPEIGSSR